MANETVLVLLAGGKSERMGIPKGLLVYNNQYWILEQLNRIAKSSVSEVYIGLGYFATDYLNMIPFFAKAKTDFVPYGNLKIRIIINETPEKGSFSTLQSVLNHVPKTSAVLVQPIDVPLLNATELEQIIQTHHTIVIPQHEDINGHPVKLSTSFWNPLLLEDVDNPGARLDFFIKKKNPEHCYKVKVQDSDCILNLNTPNDWEFYLHKK